MTITTQYTIGDLAPDTSEGEAAKILDPLWMLGRQWQLGELDGDDAGSPVGARMLVEAALLSAWRPVGSVGSSAAAQPAQAFAPQQRPIEANVEAEAWATGTHEHVRLACEMAQALARLLSAAKLDATTAVLKAAYPLRARPADEPPNPASARYLALMSGRAFDGVALYLALQPLALQGRLQDALTQAPLSQTTDDHAKVTGQLKIWWADCADFTTGVLATAQPIGNAASWQPDRMEYAFAMSGKLSDGEVTLVAGEHFDGATDWHSFAIDPTLSLQDQGDSQTQSFTFLPTPIAFPGMPKPRFWELEDANVNLPRLGRERDDPASALFVDFALRFGNDWFSVPLPLPPGSISRIRAMLVTDTFGAQVSVQHANSGQGGEWKMYSLVGTAGPGAVPRDDVFLLPPTLAQVLDSAPVEQVRLARDESANVGWAIESMVESVTGHRIDRAESYVHNLTARQEPKAAPAANAGAVAGAAARYRLGSTIPDFWIPLLPSRTDQTLLVRAAAPRVAKGIDLVPIPAAGRILEPGQPLTIRDEEVPGDGVSLTRRYRYARSADGRCVLWIGRLKQHGRGEASCGLRFDTVEKT